jgi:histidinol-phosphate/aromatic aminotransferase/cobyric acid decarboxylase-like protein
MAGLRCGLAIARPDLLQKISAFSGWNSLPVTAVAAAITSLSDPSLVPARRKINAEVRSGAFAFFDRHGYKYTPSTSNCFMLDTRRPTKEVIEAMAARNVYIGRAWPVWPTHVRITVGTQAEMEKFEAAFREFMQGKPAQTVAPRHRSLWARLDGVHAPSP